MGAADATSDGSGGSGPPTAPRASALTLDAGPAAASELAVTVTASAGPSAVSGARTQPPRSVVSHPGIRRPPVTDWERYHIEGFLGAGGMGSVFKARDSRLGRFVALKFLRDGDAQPEQRRRFDREARAQARLDHPNICKISVAA